VSCKAVGGIPAPIVVLKIDKEYIINRTQSVQHTLNTINRSYHRKTVTCQAGNPAYSQDPISSTAVIYLNCK